MYVHYQFDTSEVLSQFFCSFLNSGFLKQFFETIGIDPNGKYVDSHHMAMMLHPFWTSVQGQDSSACAQEVSTIVVCLEPN